MKGAMLLCCCGLLRCCVAVRPCCGAAMRCAWSLAWLLGCLVAWLLGLDHVCVNRGLRF